MKTAQELLKDLLKGSIAPRLRECGLSGSGQNYSLKSDHYWSLLSFQKSVYSSSDGLSFTVNLYVVSKSDWDAERVRRKTYPKTPTATFQWSVGWNSRIGEVLPIQKDHWWPLDGNSDLETLAQEVVAAIRDYAIPAMRARMTE